MEKKVLIVDDEMDVLTVLEKRLSDAGYSVIKAESGEEAITKAKSQRPNLIILDMVMPGMDGAETANILKNDPVTKDIPVMFLTVLFTKEDEKAGHLIGGAFFIAKPYSPDELLKHVSEHIKP